MSIAKGRTFNITTSDILSKVTEAQILGYYLGITRIPCVINSPLRPDRNPSFGLYSLDGKKIYYKDFSKRIINDSWGDTFYLLARLWNLEMGETLGKIYNELVLHKQDLSPVDMSNSGIKGSITYASNVDLKVKIRDFKSHDIEFWEQFGISKSWLEFSNTYAISHIFVTKNGKKFTINADKYAYVYVEFKDGVPSLKIYQPFSENFKWTNKHDGSVWDLWKQLPATGEHLIISSSRKDALCTWENSGIPSCSLQAESYLPKVQVINELKNRFKKVHVLYDNDFDKEINYGELYAQELVNHFQLNKLTIPSDLLVKDTSDMCKKYGRESVYNFIHNQINKN